MKRILNENVLKIIGILSMTCDHIGACLWMVYVDTTSVGYLVGYILRIIGRLSLPLFIFMLVEGLRHTSNKWKYCGRIGMICLPMTIIELVIGAIMKDMTIMPPHAFTELLLFALIATLWSGKWWQKLLSSLPIAYILLSFLADVFLYHGVGALNWFVPALWADYDLFGFALFVAFYFSYPLADVISRKFSQSTNFDLKVFRQSDDYRKLSNYTAFIMLLLVNVFFWALAYFFGQTTDTYLYQYHSQTYSVISGLFILLYNGKRGYDSKWFRIANYLYYPVHIIIIYGIFMILFWT